MAGSQSGSDNEKLGLLYETYGRLMLYRARQITGDHFLAQDVVQDTCIKLLKNMDKIGDIPSKRTRCFLMIVVESVARDHTAGRHRNDISFESSDCQEMPDELDYEDIISQEIDIKTAADKMKYLSDSNWHILVLRYVNELSIKDIASLLGISADAASKRIVRACRRLEKIISDDSTEYQYDD